MTVVGICLPILLLGVLAPAAIGANVIFPATYRGPAATGGTVEFVVAADGSSVSRFSAALVPTTCGTVSATETGSFSISKDVFSSSQNAPGLRFSGAFTAPQQAQGSLSYRISGKDSCTSASIAWTASTSATRDRRPPRTRIRSGPPKRTTARKATFRFRSSERGSTFQCRLDRRRWRSCRSPKTYRRLKVGRHVFRVRARDRAGNVDRTPAKRVWRVKARG